MCGGKCVIFGYRHVVNAFKLKEIYSGKSKKRVMMVKIAATRLKLLLCVGRSSKPVTETVLEYILEGFKFLYYFYVVFYILRVFF